MGEEEGKERSAVNGQTVEILVISGGRSSGWYLSRLLSFQAARDLREKRRSQAQVRDKKSPGEDRGNSQTGFHQQLVLCPVWLLPSRLNRLTPRDLLTHLLSRGSPFQGPLNLFLTDRPLESYFLTTVSFSCLPRALDGTLRRQEPFHRECFYVTGTRLSYLLFTFPPSSSYPLTIQTIIFLYCMRLDEEWIPCTGG